MWYHRRVSGQRRHIPRPLGFDVGGAGVSANGNRPQIGRRDHQLGSRPARARLELIVTSNNDVAIGFYNRLGFTFTGKTGPYRNDPALTDLEMIYSISAD